MGDCVDTAAESAITGEANNEAVDATDCGCLGVEGSELDDDAGSLEILGKISIYFNYTNNLV